MMHTQNTKHSNTTAIGAAVSKISIFNVNKKVILKTCAPFTSCIIEINNTQVDILKTFL